MLTEMDKAREHQATNIYKERKETFEHTLLGCFTWLPSSFGMILKKTPA